MRVEPAEHFVNWQQDAFGNFLARLVFPEPAQELSVVVGLVADLDVVNPFDFFVEELAEYFPFAYSPQLTADLEPYLRPVGESGSGPGELVRDWVRAHPPQGDPRTIDFLVTLNSALRRDVGYTVRLEPGVQTPDHTLRTGLGSCRDSAWLLVSILREFGMAARFVSGYLIQLSQDVPSLDGPSGPPADFTDLHAWTEVYLPGAGWIGLDPTSGLFAGEGHIPLAATPHPVSSAPITGATDPVRATLDFSNAVRRIHEDPRITLPYTDTQWTRITAVGALVDDRTRAADIGLTVGGEPTFVSIDDQTAPEWTTAADGAHKRERAADLARRLRRIYAPQGLVQYRQGKWYPGEPLPRWEIALLWREDGEPLWTRPDLLTDPWLPADHHPVAAPAADIRALASRDGRDPAGAGPDRSARAERRANSGDANSAGPASGDGGSAGARFTGVDSMGATSEDAATGAAESTKTPAGKPVPRSDGPGIDMARAIVEHVSDGLGLPRTQVRAAYEDALLRTAAKARSPQGDPPGHTDDLGPGADSAQARADLLARLDATVDQPTAFVLPLHRRDDEAGWASADWQLRRGRIVLTEGDSPAGLRLPLGAISWSAPRSRPESDPFTAHQLPGPRSSPRGSNSPVDESISSSRPTGGRARSGTDHATAGAGGQHSVDSEQTATAAGNRTPATNTAPSRPEADVGGSQSEPVESSRPSVEVSGRNGAEQPGGSGGDRASAAGRIPDAEWPDSADRDDPAAAASGPIDLKDIAAPLFSASDEPLAVVEPAAGAPTTALVAEVRHGRLYLFLPPVERIEAFYDLIWRVEAAVAAVGQPVVLEGYGPPVDTRLSSLSVTPDPGVIEVNVQPSVSFADQARLLDTLYEQARLARLSTESFDIDGTHSGTGGGNHITLGGRTPARSPMLRRPDVLVSMLTCWQRHPALSYLFSGRFVGPTSQAPRVDEGRSDTLYELEIAFAEIARLAGGRGEKGSAPWEVDRALRHLLTDLTGNTHRAEFCIDKLYSPDSARGRLGLVELRGFEMPPHFRMAMVQSLLVRALVLRFWEQPYTAPLIRHGANLHGRYLLPHFLLADIADVAADLRAHGIDFDISWLEPFAEFRFPRIGTVVLGGMEVELRGAIEPWNTLGEQTAATGTARYVDSSVERLQVRVVGADRGRFALTCNGFPVPLLATEKEDVQVAGVRYRAWQPPNSLHPSLSPDAPLVFDLIDLDAGISRGGCTYHVSHPGGMYFAEPPVNAVVAQSRRNRRFEPLGHTSGPVDIADLRATMARQATDVGAPGILDLRRARTVWAPTGGR